MTTKKNTFYLIAKVVSWIIFLGLCVQTGALIFNYIFSLFKPVAIHNLYMGMDLSNLYDYSKTHYSILLLLLIITSGLTAYVFYLVVGIFSKLNIVKPFSPEIAALISKIGYFILAIGILDFLALQYANGIEHASIELNEIKEYWYDGNAFIMMAAIIFVFVQIFKKGIELQDENDLTF